MLYFCYLQSSYRLEWENDCRTGSKNVVWQLRNWREAIGATAWPYGKVVWLTGLQAAGKSTLAYATKARLHQLGYETFVLDGDNLRHGVCADLGFWLADRSENIRRIGAVGKLMLEQEQNEKRTYVLP